MPISPDLFAPDVFGATLKLTVPLPVWVAFPVIVMNPEKATAFQVQSAGAVTANVPEPLPAPRV